MQARRTVYLLRHGETDWNAAGRLQGHTDTPLNDIGRAQARRAAELLGRVSLSGAVSSDLGRARETAEIVARLLDLPVSVDAALRERCFGIFEGLTWDDVVTRHPDLHQAYLKDRNARIPGAETLAEAGERAMTAVLRALVQGTPERPVLVVTHGGVIRALLGALWRPGAGQKGIPNCVPFQVEIEEGAIVSSITLEARSDLASSE